MSTILGYGSRRAESSPGSAGRIEEFPVGAFARRQRRRRLLLSGFGVGLILTAGVLLAWLRPRGDALAGGHYPVQVVCRACGFEGVTAVRLGVRRPLTCPRCGQPQAQEVWKCRRCGMRFTAARAEPARCPGCGSQQVGSAAAP